MRYWPVCASLLLHALLLLIVYTKVDIKPSSVYVKVDTATIEIKHRRASGSVPKNSTNGRKSRPKLSNRSAFDGDVGQQATAANYIERVRGRVEPVWRPRVAERVRQLRAMGKPYKCITCCEVLLSPAGTPTLATLSQQCHDQPLNAIAAAALDQQLPPVPANLLQDGALALEWCFEVL